MQVPWGEASCLSWCVVHLQGPANCPVCHKHLLRAWDGRDVPSPRQLWNHTPFILCSSQPLYNSSTSLGEHCHSFQGLVKCWLSLPGASLLIWLYLVSIHFLPSTTYTPDQTPSYNCFFYKQMFTFLFISWDRGPYSPVGWFWTLTLLFHRQRAYIIGRGMVYAVLRTEPRTSRVLPTESDPLLLLTQINTLYL